MLYHGDDFDQILCDELHLSVLIETLRREGFEFEVGRPQVVSILLQC